MFSQYDVVRKFESSDDELVSVGEFLDRVRDIVLRFSIGRLLSEYASGDEVEQIDDLTRYYLLHRNWFGHNDVDAGGDKIRCGMRIYRFSIGWKG